MKNLFPRLFAILAFVGVGLWVSCSKTKIHLATRNASGDLEALLVWKDNNITPGGNCILVVKNAAGNVVFERVLLENRDDFEDVKAEFSDLAVDGRVVRLGLSRKHYKGPAEIAVP